VWYAVEYVSLAIVDRILCLVLFSVHFGLAYLDATQHMTTFVPLQPK
jgi:hypothetical protein